MILTVKNISKSYGSFQALNGIDLTMHNGIYALLAPNGAGKTTLLQILATILPPDSGTVQLDGVDIGNIGNDYRSVLGYLPQQIGYYPNYTPEQFLRYMAAVKGIPKDLVKERIAWATTNVELGQAAKKPMKKLSGGMVQRVGIAMALLNDPKILLLDEPTAGLDPNERAKIKRLLGELARDKLIIISTHIISDVDFIANHIILIKNGTIQKQGSIQELTQSLQGKVFETTVEASQMNGDYQGHPIISVKSIDQGTGYKIKFYSETRESDQWVDCVPVLEDVALSLYGETMGQLGGGQL